MTRRVLAIGLLITAFVPVPRVAWADARTDARRFFREGMQLIKQGDLSGGVASLQRAYETLPHPNVLFNIARAYLDAGRQDEAMPYLEQYLASDPPDREEVEQALASIRRGQQAERPAVGRGFEAAQAPPPALAASRAAAAGEYLLSDNDVDAIALAADQLDILAEAAQSAPLGQQAAELRRLASNLASHRGVVVASAPAAASFAAKPQPAPPASNAFTQPLAFEQEPAEQEGVYEARVVSASRFVQSTLDAPNSTTIITAQDIRLSGQHSLPEIMRRAAGVEVMTLTPGSPELAIRGSNKRLSNTVQVLVDGRSVYLDFLGTTLWSMVPVLPEEIDRIEVIRGPASALYGANAFGGVVNLILRNPGSGGSLVSASLGSGGVGRGAVSVNGRAQRLNYRVGVGYQQEDHHSIEADPERVDIEILRDNPDRALERLIADVDVLYRLPRGLELRGGAAVSRSSFALMAIGRVRQLVLDEMLAAQAYASLNTPIGVSLRTFTNVLGGTVLQPYAPPGSIEILSEDVSSNVIDNELVYRTEFTLGVDHNLSLGLGYRYKTVTWNWLDDAHDEHHYSAFMQDTVGIAEAVQAVVSARVDRHPLLASLQFSPRGSVIVRPTDDSAVRAMVATAFRSPTFIESYLHFVNQTPVRGSTAYGEGNTELDPERILSAELGYAQQLVDLLELEVNAYYNRLDNKILFASIQPYRLGDYPGYDAPSSAFPLGELQFTNEDATFQQLGGEVAVHLFPITGLDVDASYSFHQTSPVGDVDLQGREEDQRTPAHKVNIGAQYRSSFGVDLALDLHYVSSQRWVEQVTDTRTGVRFEPFDLGGYTLLNAHIGLRLADDNVELGVTGTSLLGGRHREHPFGEKIGPRVWGSLAVRL